MKHFIFASIALLLLVSSAFAQTETKPEKPDNLLTFPTGTLEIETDTGPTVFDIELALDPPRHEQGLMFREEMADDEGMLFMFPQEAMRGFWMRNTLIPLDIIYADKGGKVVHIAKNAKPLDETGLSSEFPAQFVFEVNGGLTDQIGIRPGHRLLQVKMDPPVDDDKAADEKAANDN